MKDNGDMITTCTVVISFYHQTSTLIAISNKLDERYRRELSFPSTRLG
ncbi:hypothetical protein BN1221_03937c [Brenneria goodwinii]|uniref:Uncharacterized protein n=1 Tax=Brenneria goodwinii TaxID=1109412 RepID=A0A0G4JZT0_9GAMM|nr:hypothetical protein BN1221_03937c [Brenneria goodwinii]